MKRRQIRQSRKNGAPGWMVTYADMVTLILVFFILLFSMSQIDEGKFERVTESFQSRSILDFSPSTVPGDDQSDGIVGEEDPDGEEQTEDEILDDLVTEVESYLDEQNLNDLVSADRTERGVVLVLQESILFESGEADIFENAEDLLNEIGSLIADISNHVRVEGHTDSRPISNSIYPSNWELSGARASSVVRYFLEEFDIREDRLSTVGYADTRPVADNDSPENRSENRRVEIVILSERVEEMTEN